MSKKIILYDLRIENFPNEHVFEFRTLQVFKCWVCSALSNNVTRRYSISTVTGWQGMELSITCPHSSECWHHELYRKVRWLKSHPHPKSYKDELKQEIDEELNELRPLVCNDLVGNPDTSLEKGMTCVFSSKHYALACEHVLRSLHE